MVRLLVLFNPRMSAGIVYMKERNNQANVIKLSAIDHPNVVTGDNVIPGAVTREITVRRINEWSRPLGMNERIGVDTFEVPDILVGCTAKSQAGIGYEPLVKGVRKIINPALSYMTFGEYPAQSETQLISQDWIDAARNRWDMYVATYGERPPVGIRPKIGLDVAELGVDANVAAKRYGGYVPKLLTWSGVDTDFTARKALMLYRESNADIMYVDATGLGSGVAPSVSRMSREHKDAEHARVVGVKFAGKPSPFITTEMGEFYQLRDQLWWAMREWLRTNPTSMLPPDPFLIDELKAPSYHIEVTNGKLKVTDKDTMRGLLRRSPDRAEALALTFTPQARPKVIRVGLQG